MERCPDNETLSTAVVDAVRRSYDAKHDLEAAMQKKIEIHAFSVALGEARINERKAVKALDAHRKEHGC